MKWKPTKGRAHTEGIRQGVRNLPGFTATSRSSDDGEVTLPQGRLFDREANAQPTD